MPPLPDVSSIVYFTGQERQERLIHAAMCDYGRQCVEDYKKSQKPVAWGSVGFGQVMNTTLKEAEAEKWKERGGNVIPLYRLD